jgi:hypothetical protein
MCQRRQVGSLIIRAEIEEMFDEQVVSLDMKIVVLSGLSNCKHLNHTFPREIFSGFQSTAQSSGSTTRGTGATSSSTSTWRRSRTSSASPAEVHHH